MPFYAVAKGFNTGVFQSWAECEQNVKGFKGASFKKFNTLVEAKKFIAQAQPAPDTKQNRNPILALQKNGGGLSASLSACTSSIAYLARKKQENAETLGKKENSVDIKSIKKEPADCLDYIPLQCNENNIKREIKKEEDPECSLFFVDAEGDEELLRTMAALQEYPARSQKRAKKRKNNTNRAGTTCQQQNKRIKIGHYNFTTDNDGFVDVYIGGNHENIGSWNCMAGYGVYFGENHPFNVAEAAKGRISRNVGDIQAAVYAIQKAKDAGIEKLCLHTQSEFLLKAVTGWIFSWKRNGWRNQNGKVVANRKEFQQLDKLLNDDAISIKWNQIKGGNNDGKALRAVGKLAQYGTDEYLEQHPSKDLDGSFADFDFDFY